MKKLNVILDETTIINFGFFKKLIVRYYISSILVPLIVAGFAYNFYVSQNIIYLQSNSFKNVSNDADSPTLAIAKIIGESSQGIESSEVVGMTRSLDFYKFLAEDIYSTGNFLKMNLNSLNSKGKIDSVHLFSHCNDQKECIVKEMMGLLPGFILLDVDPLSVKRFNLKVKTLDKWTTSFLLSRVEKSLQDMRLNSIKYMISQQMSVMQELVVAEKEKLKIDGPISLEDQNNSLKSDISSLNVRIKLSQENLHRKQVELDLAESQLEQTNKELKKKFSQTDDQLSKRAKALNKKIEKLSQDISAVEVSLNDLSIEDKSIIGQLKDELNQAIKELNVIPNYKKYIDSTEDYLDKKDTNSNNIAFDVKVKRAQVEKAKVEIDELKVKLNKIVRQQSELGSSLSSITPQLEYVKLLENKLVQLTLLESTIVSDFVFLENVAEPTIYKRTTSGKVTLFAILASFFVVFAVVLLRYLLDTKIYDEYELKKNFENLDVIGSTPDFNQ